MLQSGRMIDRPPRGTVTFLFTDIEGSTTRWEHEPELMSPALARHDHLLRRIFEQHNGYVFKMMGDAFHAAFSTANDALQAAVEAQLALFTEDWAEGKAIKVRMALYTGAAEQRDGDYFGQPLNRVARIMAAGHGGQILLSQATYDLVKSQLHSDIEFTDMGEHRLKDLTHPEHIYQVVAQGLERDFPPLRTLDYRPNNLPRQITTLVGRERAIADLVDMLSRRNVALVTLTGPGGTGKTRLGLQVGADLLDAFPDGVWFVDLAALTEPGLVISTIAQTLGVKEAGQQPILNTLKSYLKEKHLLLLLDNFEQVVEAAGSVSQIILSCAHIKVIVTSRIPLRIRGEKEYPVSPLALPDPGRLPAAERLAEYDAIKLFVDRATEVKPNFQLGHVNATAIAEICARLDGLPLAIELAAARIRVFTPQDLLSRLTNRMKMLTGGARDLPARQQTIRNTIEWSYDLLSDGEKQLFRRMAVFQGGRTLEALEAVCNAEGDLPVDVLDGVESLVSKSLLRQGEGAGGEARFAMLETIHEYAREKLAESGETDTLQHEHAAYFMAKVEEAEPHLRGAKQREWHQRLDEEHDNVRAALDWAELKGSEGNAEAINIGLRITGVMGRFWDTYG